MPPEYALPIAYGHLESGDLLYAPSSGAEGRSIKAESRLCRTVTKPVDRAKFEHVEGKPELRPTSVGQTRPTGIVAACTVLAFEDDVAVCLVERNGGQMEVEFPIGTIRALRLREGQMFDWRPVRGRHARPEDCTPIHDEQLSPEEDAGWREWVAAGRSLDEIQDD